MCFVGGLQITVIWFQPEQAPQTNPGRQALYRSGRRSQFSFLSKPWLGRCIHRKIEQKARDHCPLKHPSGLLGSGVIYSEPAHPEHARV